MHICADEIVALLTGVSALAGLRLFLKAKLGAIRAYFAKPKVEVPAPVVPRTPLDEEAEVLGRWVKDVAPILVQPEKDPYAGRRVTRDLTGYLVAGFMWPIYPAPYPADYVIDRAGGWRLATADESRQMRKG